MQHHQGASVQYFVKRYQIPSKTGTELSFNGIMRIVDKAEMWLSKWETLY